MRLNLIIFAAIALVTTSCHSQSVTAPREEVAPSVAVAEFPAESLLLKDNKLFLWKADATRAQVQSILENSSKLDELTDLALEMEKNQNALRARFAASSLDADEIQQEMTNAQGKIDFVTAQLARLTMDLEGELSKSEADRDSTKITRLKKRITQANTNLNRANEAMTAQKERLSGAGLEEDFEEWKKLGADRAARADEPSQIAQRIKESVEMFEEQPSLIRFTLNTDGSFSGLIANWNAETGQGVSVYTTSDVAIEYDQEIEGIKVLASSVKQGSISDLTYSPRGGVFNFKVQAGASVYEFKIARTKYNAADGRKYFQGDITRVDAGIQKKRRGVAKLADRKK